MDYTGVVFKNITEEQKDILIAMLSSSGYDGFEEEGTALKAYISQKAFNKDLVDELAEKYAADYSLINVPGTNWNKAWESNFEPVIIDNFCMIRAEFHEPVTNVLHEIIITPKMSFGTGHHATTYMMIRQMEQISFQGKKVFDFGTGTGVLAILAKQLGASAVVAADNDDWSIENATENFLKNNAEITLFKADNANGEEMFDIILANITLNVILENLKFFHARLNKNGILLLSGLLLDDEQKIVEAIRAYGMILLKKLERSGWISLQFTRS